MGLIERPTGDSELPFEGHFFPLLTKPAEGRRQDSLDIGQRFFPRKEPFFVFLRARLGEYFDFWRVSLIDTEL